MEAGARCYDVISEWVLRTGAAGHSQPVMFPGHGSRPPHTLLFLVTTRAPKFRGGFTIMEKAPHAKFDANIKVMKGCLGV